MKKILPLLNLEHLALVIVLSVAAFFRIFRIGDYLTFLGDEGRDVLVVRGILHGDFTLLGPRASAGDFFLGPMYYYFMAPFLWAWNYDPVGPAIMVAIFGVVTVGLVYYLGKKFFGTWAGLSAAALYSVSPVVIAYSRSSWNPNLMPFFSVLIFLLLFKAMKEKKKSLFLIIGVLFGVTMQLHYLATFVGAIVVAYILYTQFFIERTGKIKEIVSVYLLLLAGFLVGFSPFLAFEARHGFPNMRTIFGFIFQNTFEKSYADSTSFILVISDVFFRLFGRLVMRFPPPEQVSVQTNSDVAYLYYATLALAFLSMSLFLWQFVRYMRKQDTEKLREYGLVFIWFLFGILLFGFYKKAIYDYYFGFLFPLPFLLIGNLLQAVVTLKKLRIIGVLVGLTVFGYVLWFNLQGAPFLSSPNRQKEQVKKIADFVLSKTDGKPYNFALITGGNSDHGYRYFFELAGRPPVVIEYTGIDPDRQSVTDQLLIVCEDTMCQPLGNSLWEVAGFGRAEIDGVWDVSVVKVYKLIPYDER